MRNSTRILSLSAGLGGLVLAASVFSSNPADANAEAPVAARTYEVTITNLTRSQMFSPPLIITHNGNFDLFEAGEAASAELQAMAENGDNSGISTLVSGNPDVMDFQEAAAGLAPGESVSFTTNAGRGFPYLSAAGMLVSTNDAFMGLDSLGMGGDSFAVNVPAYDAGTEFNSEDCSYIPGPPCDAGAVHDPAPAEGYIYVSNGIQGIGGVPSEYDWRNPVARIEITRL